MLCLGEKNSVMQLIQWSPTQFKVLSWKQFSFPVGWIRHVDRLEYTDTHTLTHVQLHPVKITQKGTNYYQYQVFDLKFNFKRKKKQKNRTLKIRFYSEILSVKFKSALYVHKMLSKTSGALSYLRRLISSRARPCIMLISSLGIVTSS